MLQLRDRDVIIQRLLSHLPVFHYKVNKERIIYEAWSANQRLVPDASALASRSLSEVFPEVWACIARTQTEDYVSCYSADGQFHHHLFKNSTHTEMYWVFAIRSDAEQ